MPRRCTLALAIAIACGDDPTPAAMKAAPDGAVSGAGEPVIPDDALLARARAGIRGGGLPEDVIAELRASEVPAHARAVRIIEAWEGVSDPPLNPDPTPTPNPNPNPNPNPTPDPNPNPNPSPEPNPIAEPIAEPGPGPGPSSAPPSRARPVLQKLAMRSASDGAVLELVTGAGVLVGVVNQPSQGIVRLVLEGVAAGPKVLAARPAVQGARVTAVEAGPKALRITIALEAGWAFDGVKRTKSGARVKLKRA